MESEKASNYSAASFEEEEHKDGESDGLLSTRILDRASNCRRICLLHILALYASNIISLAVIIALWISRPKGIFDPTLGVYSPANEAVEYVEATHFRAAMFNLTEYMGYPTVDVGISKISKEQASKLHSPTIAIPGTEDYLIELDVWHELHCLNDLRKLLYPEIYGGLSEVTWPNGTINRDTDAFRHWDHCVDSLRQAIMCHADVAPIPFHVNVPSNKGIFPRLATTHTCRNFEQIQQWARKNWAGAWDFNLNPEKAEEIITASGFDNGPEEDIQFLWRLFPGNPYFKHWRENLVD